tara:strand:- start:228 stop:968 length:741 start_codon:yes stop_codon:yes gene_type:complete
MNKIHLVLVGPLRPNIDYVLHLVNEFKKDIPNIITHISYWKTTSDDKKLLQDNIDFIYENEEPSLEFCVKLIYRVFKQIANEDYALYRMINVYKSFVNMHYFLNKSINNISDNDIVIRIRTDVIYQIINNTSFNTFINNFAKIPSTKMYCMVKRTDVWRGPCDWFAISSYKNIKDVWNFPDIMTTNKTYNNIISSLYNAEQIIEKKMNDNNIKCVCLNDIMRLALCRNYDSNTGKISQCGLGNTIN